MFHSKIIYEYQVGLLFRNGVFQKVLPAGKVRWFGKNTTVQVFDVRPEHNFVFAHDVMTKDGATVRAGLLVEQAIVDAKAFLFSQSEIGDRGRLNPSSVVLTSTAGQQPEHAVRMALRDWIVVRTLNEAVEQREEICDTVKSQVGAFAQSIGVEVRAIRLHDFTVIGNLRAAYSDLLKAELEGRAAMQRARNEAATMRSLLNTARLVRENPGLLELRALGSGQRPRLNFVIDSSGRAQPEVPASDEE
ncbi:MAG TPA: SPFH domain-containing protein [Fimbriimonadaceae bacterium]|nr:SPFH domain-containing protein [Fimbriimonadaceae bacterium]HRJ32784.1 SPFH domain-containing protein [Fimbriimonadaceae bacterium]